MSRDEQGWVMGVTGAIMALCFGLTSFLTAYLASYGVNVPLILAVIGMAITAILMSTINRSEIEYQSD
ncbi:hypothetical protein [Coxiella burnetii]|uniref:hypothetical protein n=2 Tax=Coxiella burnetii TaxID=777 RepID=UPI0012D2B5E4|nr:hypothetical protein [Coxiella burnetii]